MEKSGFFAAWTGARAVSVLAKQATKDYEHVREETHCPPRAWWNESVMSELRTFGIGGEARFGNYVALLKPRVMSLVVFTALVGLLAAPESVTPLTTVSRSR